MRLKRGTMWRAEAEDSGRISLYDPLSDATATAVGPPAGGGDFTRAALAEPRTGIAEAAECFYFQDPAERGLAWNVELTDSCTFACRHCYAATRKREPWERADGPLTAGWPRLAEAVLAAGPAEVSLTGGEVLLADAAVPLLERLRTRSPSLPLRVLLSGMALAQRQTFRDLLPRLAEWRVLAKVAVYSARGPLHDSVTRSPGSLVDTLALIDALRGVGVAVAVSYEILGLAAGSAVETAALLRERVGAEFAVSTLVFPPRAGEARRGCELVAPKQMLELLGRREFAALPVEYLAFQPRCASGCRFPAILPLGGVLGCAVLAESACGNLYDDPGSLGRAKASQPFAPCEAAFAACEGCSALPVCKGCAAFVSRPTFRERYCGLVRACAGVVARRIEEAMGRGYRFAHAAAARVGVELVSKSV